MTEKIIAAIFVLVLASGFALKRFNLSGHLAARVPHLEGPIGDYLARMGCESDPGNSAVWHRVQDGHRIICDIDYDQLMRQSIRRAPKMALDPAEPFTFNRERKPWQDLEGFVISTVGLIDNPPASWRAFGDTTGGLATVSHPATLPKSALDRHAASAHKEVRRHLFDAESMDAHQKLFGPRHRGTNNNFEDLLSTACLKGFNIPSAPSQPHLLHSEYDFCTPGARRR